MKNLIEEIEKIIEDLKIEKQKCFEEIDYPLSQVDRLEGRILAYTDILMALNQYNIITAPKQIKLSEIVSKLKESNEYLDFEFETTLDFKKAIGVNYKSYDGEYYFDECVVFNENMTIERVCLESTKYKWLYTLWIAGTEIVDDLECDDDES